MEMTVQVRDDARAPTHFKRLRAGGLAAALATSAVVLLAACAGSSNPSTGADGSSSAASSSAAGGDNTKSLAASPSTQANVLKFSRCMRSHGVPNFPDPKNGGELSLVGTGVNRNSPAFQSASKACQSLMPGGVGGVGPSGQKSDMSRAQGLSLAKCMRAHGVPNFPDPDASGAIPPGSVDLNSPQVKSAFQACRSSGSTPSP
jgi:hypothetical protein